MTLVVPNVGEVLALELYLESVDLTLKLYSNNITPAETDTAATYTVVAGGGYADQVLDKDEWTIVAGAPSAGTYNFTIDFDFTGVTNAPGVIYGYFVVDAAGVLRWAERFPAGVVPFTPILNSLIRFIPRFEAS